jgi:hypothetical protein
LRQFFKTFQFLIVTWVYIKIGKEKMKNEKQANPKVLDYISQTMVYYPKINATSKMRCYYK